MSKVIEIIHGSAFYGNNKILHDVSFEAGEGEFVVLIGPSGCGKTTLLKMVNGLVPAKEGCVKIEGKELSDCDLITLRRKIGYVVQGAKLFPHMTVEDNICYVPEISGEFTGKKIKQEKQQLSAGS